MKTLMVCSAGTGGGFATMMAARRYWGEKEIVLIATDSNPPNLCAASLFADEYYQVPLACDPDYNCCIGRIVQKHKPDGIVASVDQELIHLDQMLDLFGMRKKIRLAVPNRDFAEIFQDKLSVFRYLEQKGFPVPRTRLASEADNREYIFKPIKGFGSRGIFVGRAEELSLNNDLSQWIAQDLCRLPEITVDLITDKDVTHTMCRERVEIKNGVSVKARIFRDESLGVLATQLAHSLDFPYGFCFQVMLGSGNDWLITDLNPRLGAGSAMSYMVGSDFFGANIARILDSSASLGTFFKEFKGQAFVVRQYSEFLTEVQQ
ncbi:MAG: ATP-grasp domain-containing protein [Leptospirales bacterium]